MSVEIQIRPFEIGDTESVVELWNVCGLTRPWNDPKMDIRRKLRVQPDLFIVAVDAGTIRGTAMAGYDGHRGWVNYLAVDAKSRRRGIGRRLMERVQRDLEDAGCPKVNLQVRGENEEALGFYRSLGYGIDDVLSFGKRLITDS